MDDLGQTETTDGENRAAFSDYMFKLTQCEWHWGADGNGQDEQQYQTALQAWETDGAGKKSGKSFANFLNQDL